MESENYKRLGKLLKEWREAKGYTMYRLWKEIKVVRYDLLKKVEEGQGVNGNTLFAYIEFAYQNDFRVFEILFAKEDAECNETDDEQPEKDVAETTIEEDKKVSSESLKELIKDAINYHAKTKVKMSPEKQLYILKLGLCPNCGSQIEERSGKYGPFVGCIKFPTCEYSAKGTIENPFVSSKNRKDFIPLGEKK